MKNSNEFRICCCGARTWSLVIGWLQTIIFALGLVPGLVFFLMLSYRVMKGDRDSLFLAGWITLAVGLIVVLVEFIGGIFLILGVNQQNLWKIKVWKVLKIITVVVTSLIVLVLLLNFAVTLILDIPSVIVSIFSLLVVGVHEKELRATTSGFQKL